MLHAKSWMVKNITTLVGVSSSVVTGPGKHPQLQPAARNLQSKDQHF